MQTNDPRIGLDFGDYKITRKLAEGGMGAVYIAEHEGMAKVVKFILGAAVQHPAIRERFKAECKALKRFKGSDYPGIVDIDSYGERNGELYLVMEYIDGITLDDHLRTNVRLTEHHAFHIMLLCLRALSDVHAAGIVHRDLKPSNIFLRHTRDRVWEPKVIDFGIAHDEKVSLPGSAKTVAGQLVGTVGFMANEQFGSAHKVTPATDIFACAVMMWLMLTGELPWGVAPDEFEQYNRQLHQRPIWPAHVPLPHAEGWKEVLQEALSPDPARRPQSAQLFGLMLGQRLGPIPPYVPDGLGMVAKLATSFLQNVPPELETVRQADGRVDVAAFWKPNAASTPPPRMTPSQINLDQIRVSAVMQAQPVPSAATLNARPQLGVSEQYAASGVVSAAAPPAPMLSTLSAANGSSTTSPSPTRLAALGLAAALGIGGIIFGAMRLGSRPSASGSPEPAALQPASAPSSESSAAHTNATASSPPAATEPAATSGVGSAAFTASVGPATPPASSVTTAAAPEPAHRSPTPTVQTVVPDAARTVKRAPQPAPTARHNPTDVKAPPPPTSASSNGATRAGVTTNAPAAMPGAHAGSATFDPDAIKE